MKLSELREKLANGRGFVPVQNPTKDERDEWKELVVDIDKGLQDACAEGYRAGCGHTSLPDMNPGERKMAEAKAALGPIGIPDTRGEQEALKSWAVLTAHENELAKLRPVMQHTLEVFDRLGALESKAASGLELAKLMNRVLKLEQRGQGVCERVTAPADSELGVELSKIRDRLNALETYETTVLVLDKRVSVLEQRDISPAAEASIAKYQGLGKRIEELETNVTGHELRVEGLENWQSKVRGT